MNSYAKLGSLFDGIGGFMFAAVKMGITPVWASEIEKAPISITKRHFPNVRHLGDIAKLNGAEMEPVDIITFGSPCQDLSISGRRAGLGGKRSGLFMQAVRIVREMRDATKQTCPARIVWENVPGAFSSNGGRDFKTVIEEVSRIAEPGVSIPGPPDGWLAAGAVMGDSWSLAWRVLDAQYWGVPQRRRRIFLVADFGSKSAGKILFKPESRTGYFTEGENAGDSFTGTADNGNKQYAIDPGYSSDRIQMNPDIAVTLRSETGGVGAKTGLYCLPVTYCMVGNTIDRSLASGGNGTGFSEEISYTLNTVDRHAVTVPFIRNNFSGYTEGDIGKTLTASHDIVNGDLITRQYTVRRLTPTECERLQGFPDGWTEYGHDGKRISDNQRYKVLGNSVAIPCVEYVLSGIKNNL
jgi:DNA (cytosine-5)-methyltransferase 1